MTGLVQGIMSSRKNGNGITIPGLGSFGGQTNAQGSQGSMSANGNVGSSIPPNFDLNNFDLNKGLPQDFGHAPGVPVGDNSSLPEVPPRTDGNP